MLKRQRFNPSRLVKNFRQGSVKDADHSGQALVCWSTPSARTPRPKRSPALVAACWRRKSVQSLSRIRASALDGSGRTTIACIGSGQAPRVVQGITHLTIRLLRSSAGLVSP